MPTNSLKSDHLQRVLLNDGKVRGQYVHLEATLNEVFMRREYPEALMPILAELATVSVMIAAGLKRGSLIVQIQGEGALRLMVVEVNVALQVRATAEWSHELHVGAPLQDWVGPGAKCVITLDPQQPNSKMYQGIVPADQSTVAKMLEGYLENSAQSPTRVWLGSDGRAGAGLLLQKLPADSGRTYDESLIESQELFWDQSIALADTVTSDELIKLSGHELLWRLFSSEGEVRVLTPQPVSFFCSCNEERVLHTLQMLGQEDVKNLFEEQDGEISIDCQFCGKHYVIGEHHFENLFSPEDNLNVKLDASNVQH
ncbi:MAG: Hsp33 family molecular chaperone HslO [Pseudomonadota bacterium]